MDMTTTGRAWSCERHPKAHWGYFADYPQCLITDLNYANPGGMTYGKDEHRFESLAALKAVHTGVRQIYPATRFTIRVVPAGPHTKFSQAAAQSFVGQRPRFNRREHEDGEVVEDYGHVEVVAAAVDEDGAAVLLTLDVLDAS